MKGHGHARPVTSSASNANATAAVTARRRHSFAQRASTRHAEVLDRPAVNAGLKSPGSALDAGVRSAMEARFGREFSDVHVHSGGDAARSVRALNAAFTFGNDIVFDLLDTDSVESVKRNAQDYADVIGLTLTTRSEPYSSFENGARADLRAEFNERWKSNTAFHDDFGIIQTEVKMLQLETRESYGAESELGKRVRKEMQARLNAGMVPIRAQLDAVQKALNNKRKLRTGSSIGALGGAGIGAGIGGLVGGPLGAAFDAGIGGLAGMIIGGGAVERSERPEIGMEMD